MPRWWRRARSFPPMMPSLLVKYERASSVVFEVKWICCSIVCGSLDGLIQISPVSAFRLPHIKSMSVDFPQPFGPKTAMCSPRFRKKSVFEIIDWLPKEKDKPLMSSILFPDETSAEMLKLIFDS